MIKLGRGQVCALVFAGLLAAPASAAIDRWSPWGPPVGPMQQLVVDVVDADRLFLLAGEAFQAGSIYRSADGAGFWHKVSPAVACNFTTNPDERYRHFTVIAGVSPSVYATCGNELVVSRDGGATWQRRALPVAPREFLVDPADANRLLFNQGATLWASADGGVTWNSAPLPGGLPEGRLHRPVTGPPTVWFLAGRQDGLSRSVDGGVSWQTVALVDLLCSTDAGATFASCSSGGPNRDLPVDLRRVSGSDDVFVLTPHALSRWVGESWSYRRVAGATNTSREALSLNGHGVAWMVAGQPFVGPAGGLSWASADTLPQRTAVPFGSGYDVSLDPRHPGRAVAVEERWLVYSAAGGRDWTTTRFQPLAQSVLVLPSGVHLAAGCGVLRSVDDGTTWTRVRPCDLVAPSGPFYGAPRLLGDFQRARTVFAFTTTTFDQLSNVFTIFRTDDEGLNWRSVLINATAFALDPQRSTTHYAVDSGKLQRSTDDGRTWQVRSTLAAANKPTPDLVVDPLDGNHLLALVRGVGVLRSRDGGVTWAAADLGLGPNHKWLLRRLAADPSGNRRFYLMTDAGGYWIRFTD